MGNRLYVKLKTVGHYIPGREHMPGYLKIAVQLTLLHVEVKVPGDVYGQGATGMTWLPPDCFEEPGSGAAADVERELRSALLDALIAAVREARSPWVSRDRLRGALRAYEACGDHNHGAGPIKPGAPCEGGDCWVHEARGLLNQCAGCRDTSVGVVKQCPTHGKAGAL